MKTRRPLSPSLGYPAEIIQYMALIVLGAQCNQIQILR